MFQKDTVCDILFKIFAECPLKKAVFFLFFLVFSLFQVAGDELNFKFSAAVQAGDVKLASELFRSGADINYVDEDWPLFVTAASAGDIPMVEFFLKNGVDIELRGPDGKSALLHALSIKNERLADILIAAGANLDVEDANQKNTLMYAAEANNYKLLQRLLSRGYDRKKRSRGGKTALDYAVDARAVDCSRILRKLDTLPMDFINAVDNGKLSEVRQLLDDGADINTKDKNGRAAVFIAVQKGFPEILTLLIDKGADPNASYFKNKSMTLFAYAIHNKKFQEALILLRRGARSDFNYRFEGGKTALMLAVQNEKFELAELLVSKQQNINITDDYGKTALMLAVEKKNYNLVKRMLDAGSDPTMRDVGGKTAIDTAKADGNSDILKALEKAEAEWL